MCSGYGDKKMKVDLTADLCKSRYNGDPTVGQALKVLTPNAEFVIRADEKKLEWLDINTDSCPSMSDIEAKLRELRDNYPVEVLRIERNKELAKSDWMSGSDSPTMTAKWKTYRKALRDITSTQSPKLDEYGQLIGVTWPTEPEEG